MEKHGRILVVDDDNLVLESLYEAFIDEFEVLTAASGKEAVTAVGRNANLDAVVLDIRMAGMGGLETASAISKIVPDLPIIFYTGYPGDFSENKIDRQYRPYDYVVKSEQPVRLYRTVRNAVGFKKLERKSSHLIEMARAEYGMVGKSALMQAVYRTIEKIAPTDSKVMIIGPTGSGKELVARAIHKRSARSQKRLGILNCNHKQPDLVESQLFGHLKGAFTGATENRIGMFEYAHEGTLFLDEISDLDSTSQMKLLRVLETGEYQKMGSPAVERADVRVICATNKNLEELVASGDFREDLYYRLKMVTIVLPSLKERREDIPDLIDYVVEHYSIEKRDGCKIFEPAAIDLLVDYHWPGNVRELIYTVKALMDISISYYVTRADVERQLSFPGYTDNGSVSFSDQLREMKRLIIVKALVQSGNNISGAARLLSLDKSNLHKMIKELDITLG
ncbi:MAG: sigma-54 dependent transcriptional regulator [Candidatus Zixiibacteriota bacterium]